MFKMKRLQLRQRQPRPRRISTLLCFLFVCSSLLIGTTRSFSPVKRLVKRFQADSPSSSSSSSSSNNSRSIGPNGNTQNRKGGTAVATIEPTQRKNGHQSTVENKQTFTNRATATTLLNGYPSRAAASSRINQPIEVTEYFDDFADFNDGIVRINDVDDDDDDDVGCGLVDEQMELLTKEVAESTDLTREQVRMDSLDSYVVVAILTGTASFATVGSLSGSPPTEELKYLHYLGVLISVFSALCGTYATVVFSLSATYGRTAIGMGRDEAFDWFMKNSGDIRMKGFQAYVWSLGLFLAEIVLISAEQIGPEFRIPFLIGAPMVAWIMFQDWQKLIDKATVIFTNDIPTE